MNLNLPFLTLLAPLALSACGGGGGDPAAPDAAAAAADVAVVDGMVRIESLTNDQRTAAATATSQSTVNACNSVRPFYWEVGSKDAKLASGSITSPTSAVKYLSTVPMSVASASKWIYGAYVAQKLGVAGLSSNDRKFLSMRAGYITFQGCDPTQTVDSCLAFQSNGNYTPAADGKFYYGGGHMEKHANLIGLGARNDTTLTAEVQSQIGTDVAFTYTQPQLAGGLAMTPDAYAKVLRKMLSGGLRIGALLGTGPVCTNPLTCGTDQAVFTPIPTTESWHYSVAHWVEDDPVVGDGAFSSPGAFGFYPWIDASKTYYGVLARVAQNGAFTSVQCGRLIRKAWMTGTAR